MIRNCNDCGLKFQPSMPLQYYCYACRSKLVVVETRLSTFKEKRDKENLPLEVGFVAEIIPKGLSMKRLSKQMGLAHSTVSFWNCKGFIPNRLVDKFCKALGISKAELEQRFGRDNA